MLFERALCILKPRLQYRKFGAHMEHVIVFRVRGGSSVPPPPTQRHSFPNLNAGGQQQEQHGGGEEWADLGQIYDIYIYSYLYWDGGCFMTKN